MNGIYRFDIRLLIAPSQVSNLGRCRIVHCGNRENASTEVAPSRDWIVFCLEAEDIRGDQLNLVGFSSSNDGKYNVGFNTHA